MGMFKTALLIVGPLTTYSMYLSYSLGNQLPRVCRSTGNNIGMFYRYFKIIMVNLKPRDNSGELFSLLKKSDFKTQAFTRDSKLHMLNLKADIAEQLPDELTKDPFEKFRLKSEEVEVAKGITGAEHILSVLTESERLKKKRRDKIRDEEFFNNL